MGNGDGDTSLWGWMDPGSHRIPKLLWIKGKPGKKKKKNKNRKKRGEEEGTKPGNTEMHPEGSKGHHCYLG